MPLVDVGGKHGVSRSKSFQMTFRESFRQLRKRGSSVEAKDHKPKIDSKPEDDKKEGQASNEAAAAAEPKEDGPQEAKETAAPAEQPAEGTGTAEEAKIEDKKPEDAVAEGAVMQPAADAEAAEKPESAGVKGSEAGCVYNFFVFLLLLSVFRCLFQASVSSSPIKFKVKKATFHCHHLFHPL